MNETVLFGLTIHLDAIDLCDRLGRHRLCAVEFQDLGWRVRAGFGPDPLDLAVLLREVERWAAGRQIDEIPFEVDGRAYVLLTYDAQLAETG